MVNFLVSFQVLWFLSFAFLIVFIETTDDFKDLSLRARIFVQVCIVSLFLLFAKKVQIYFLPAWLNYAISFIWIVGIINAFNLLDIEDGLCGGVSFIICISLLIIALLKSDYLSIFLLLSLLPSLIVFLFFNFPSAKIFMGNSGSHFLGFVIAVLCIQQDYASLDNKVSLFIPILALAVPIMDTTYLVFARIKNRIHPLKKSPDHIFLHLLSKGYSKKTVLLLIYSITLFWCISATMLIKGFNRIFIVSLFFSVLLSLVTVLKAICKKNLN